MDEKEPVNGALVRLPLGAGQERHKDRLAGRFRAMLEQSLVTCGQVIGPTQATRVWAAAKAYRRCALLEKKLRTETLTPEQHFAAVGLLLRMEEAVVRHVQALDLDRDTSKDIFEELYRRPAQPAALAVPPPQTDDSATQARPSDSG